MNYDDFWWEYCNMIVCNLFLDFDYDGISDRVGIIFSCFFEVWWIVFFKIVKKNFVNFLYLNLWILFIVWWYYRILNEF